jgi:hypothetical protein
MGERVVTRYNSLTKMFSWVGVWRRFLISWYKPFIFWGLDLKTAIDPPAQAGSSTRTTLFCTWALKRRSSKARIGTLPGKRSQRRSCWLLRGNRRFFIGSRIVKDGQWSTLKKRPSASTGNLSWSLILTVPKRIFSYISWPMDRSSLIVDLGLLN